MSWLRLRVDVSNAEALLIVAAFVFLLAGSVWFAAQASMEHNRFVRLVDSIDAHCVQRQDGSGVCGPHSFSGVGVTP